MLTYADYFDIHRMRDERTRYATHREAGEAIREAPEPQNVAIMAGMVTFQSQFVDNLATLAHPLH